MASFKFNWKLRFRDHSTASRVEGNCVNEMALVRIAPPGRDRYSTRLPRAALRLPWAIIDASLWDEKSSPASNKAAKNAGLDHHDRFMRRPCPRPESSHFVHSIDAASWGRLSSAFDVKYIIIINLWKFSCQITPQMFAAPGVVSRLPAVRDRHHGLRSSTVVNSVYGYRYEFIDRITFEAP
jgi:hypothetical protein